MEICGIALWALAFGDVTANNVVDGLCYIGRVIANPFKVFNTEQDLGTRNYILRIFIHVNHCFMKQSVVERINL